MDNNLTHILNLAYEVEGLAMLHINRGDEADPRMAKLLREKAAKLYAEVCAFTGEEPKPEAEPARIVMEPPVELDSDQVTESIVEPEPEEPLVEVIPLDDIEIPAQEEPVPAEEDAPAEEAAEAQMEQRDEAEPMRLDEKMLREKAVDLSQAFTLNDKFRFTRELFRDSKADFAEALLALGSMNSMEEAEEYVYDDLCLDPENESVKEFMATVARHF